MPGKLLISDANILIDMDVGGLLETMFELEFDFAVPDVLFEEELKTRHPELPGLGLGIMELTGQTIEYAMELVVMYGRTRTSRNDLLALALARQETCPLLTGDADLRLACDEQGIAVHGTIWLMEQLLNAGLIDATAAAEAYAAMRRDGSRLPWADVDEQLARFPGHYP